MKSIALGIITVSFPLCAFSIIPKHSTAYYETQKPEVQEALRNGAKAKFIYRVVDDEGSPITNTVVHGTWQNDFPRKTWKEKFVTNTNGVFVAKDKVGGRFTCHIWKDGYYPSCAGMNFHWRPEVSPLVKYGKWQPYGEEKTIILKRKKNPVSLKSYNWGIDGKRFPVTNEWLALDLEMGEWCKPYGDGKHADVMVRHSGVTADKYTWDAQTEISFTNIPYAGFYSLQKDAFSDMKSCYSASTNDSAYVERTFTFTSMGQRGTTPNNEIVNMLGRDKYIVFRTRCKVDENGNLISAHFGKIFGELRSGRWCFLFRAVYGDESGVFFNPTPNDTNLEDLDRCKWSEQMEMLWPERTQVK